jgi:hypothetical protein
MLRIAKILFGALGTFFFLSGTLSGLLKISPWHLFESGRHPAGVLVIYGVVFVFPYLLMSGIIKPGEAVLTTDDEEGVMGSYGTQTAIAGRYRRQMIAIVFGVIVTMVCVAATYLPQR